LNKPTLVVALGLATLASAQETPQQYGPAEPPVEVVEPLPDPVDPKPPKEKQDEREKDVKTAEKQPKEKDRLPFDVGGRVVTQMRLSSADDSFSVGDWGSELALEQARIEVLYNWKDRLRANLELELARGDTEVRDAWMRLDLGEWRVRAGYFKSAISGIENSSILKQPLTERGLLNDVLIEVFRIGDRHPGVQAELRRGIAFVDVGVWQGDTLETLGDGGGLRVAGRGGVDWKGDGGELEAGISAEVRSVRPSALAAPDARFAVGVDARWEKAFGKNTLELWGELMIGSTEIAADNDGDAIFLALRFIAGWRFGGDKRGDWYAEPYAQLQGIDGDNEIRKDLIWETGVGVNVGMWRRWRMQIAGTVRRVGEQASRVGGDGQVMPDRNRLVVGLGMEF
jgi:Phosphate-selective porin O and P